MNCKTMEICKAFAYGKTPEEVAAAMDVSVEEAVAIQTVNADVIASIRADLTEGGYLNA